MKSIGIEKIRNAIQAKLDKQKTQLERNKLGQFATPTDLANDVLSHAKTLLGGSFPISFLDPAIGTGSFFNALLENFGEKELFKATGYEIDSHYGIPAKQLWAGTILDYNIDDFTSQKIPNKEKDKYDLLICNPPYVRHQHLAGKKEILNELAFKHCNMRLSGLAGLYCYFMGISHPWLKKNGLAGWLIPSEFMDVNYGSVIKEYLLNEVTLIQIHRFDPNDLQFSDALVSSAVVWYKNVKPKKEHDVTFTYGGKLSEPKIKKQINSIILKSERKWSRFPVLEERTKHTNLRLGDFFTIKRGIATGNNKFFILSKDEIVSKNLPFSQFKPILPNPRDLDNTTIEKDARGNPIVDKKLFVLDSKLSLDEIKNAFPELFNYLQKGIAEQVSDSYLVKSRKLWYKQEERLPAPFYCTYIGRTNDANKNPFRFILNKSEAIATNSYLFLYPKSNMSYLVNSNPRILERVKNYLDEISVSDIMEEGRVYGGGMYKVEPRELAKVSAVDLKLLIEQE